MISLSTVCDPPAYYSRHTPKAQCIIAILICVIGLVLLSALSDGTVDIFGYPNIVWGHCQGLRNLYALRSRRCMRLLIFIRWQQSSPVFGSPLFYDSLSKSNCWLITRLRSPITKARVAGVTIRCFCPNTTLNLVYATLLGQ